MSKWMDVFYHVDMPDTRSDSDMAETGNMNGCYSLLVIYYSIKYTTDIMFNYT